MKIIIIVLTLTIGVVCIAKAQDIHFSQYQYAPITLNPALAGANLDVQGVLNYKTQWKSVTGQPYSTINASFDMRVIKFMKGFFASGLSVYNDKAGDGSLTTTTATLPIAYHLRLDRKNSLGAALYIAGGQKTISADNFQWAKQYDGTSFNSALANGETINKPSYMFLDVGVGVLYAYKKNYRNMSSNDNVAVNAGAALYHMNKPKNTFVNNTTNDRLAMRLSMFASASIGIQQTNISLSPALYYNWQGTQQELLGGTYVKYALQSSSQITGLIQASGISLGVFYRAKDAVVIKSMFEYSNYSAGVAYDVNVSSLSKVSKTRGGFEVFVRYVLDTNKFRIKMSI